MSEFTDYMALHTAAESLGALEAAIVQSVGAAEVPLELLPLGEGAGQTAATAAWGAVEKPLWVLLGSDALVEDLARAGRAFHLMVEDDLSTWALAVHFADFTTVLAFPRDPEAARVATVQYLETQVYDTQANDVEMADGEVAADEPEEKARFAYPPSLVVVDGGPPQVAAAKKAMDELGITDVALCGLAKRLEEVWVPGDDYPVILQRSSEGLYLLQRVRDEAHRFAITQHRRRRSKGMTASVLDDVPGLGPARRKMLLTHFGSVKRLKAASVEEIASVRGMGDKTAEAVVAALKA